MTSHPVHSAPSLPSQSPRTPYQELLAARAHAAADWLVRSIEACGGNGSVDYYSRWYHPIRGWGWPYPETTGYLIPTLLHYEKFSGRPGLTELALRQADWIVSLQYPSGALPAHGVVRGQKREPSVFNTAQMILGLVAAADCSHDKKYLDAAERAACWLVGEVDRVAGIWTAHAYVAGYSPAYHSRTCWPMLEAWRRTGLEEIKQVAVQVLDTILGWQQENGAFANWGFAPNRPAFTHTIAYTLDGLLESARLLGPEGDRFLHAALKTADVLRRRMELRGRLAGAYDIQLRGRYWFTCLTGNCQMALIWMRAADLLNDARFFSAALKALDFVVRRQRMRPIDPNVRGAIPGSSPFWGRYLTLRYPNWATKFYLDALMAAHERLQRLLEAGPCESS